MKNSPFPLLVPIVFLSLPALGAESETPDALPLRDVALFSSGVGYFGRSGEITGNARVELHVKAPQISDLLKSLVLFDPKGSIKPVSYSLADWLGNRPQDTDLDLGNGSSPGALLRGFQGASVRVERPAGAIEGRILSVNERQIMVGDKLVSVEHLSLLTNNGVQTIRLDDISSFKLLDPALDAKLMATLEKRANALTQRLDDGARAVALNFGGQGAREVRAGYLLETPAWKTSYRLVLDGKKKPYLQGWAIVENTTDEDWKDVHLSLISGRPISFIQDLAAPVYVSRPNIAPMIIGSPNPQTFGESFDAKAPLSNAPEEMSVAEDENANETSVVLNGPSSGAGAARDIPLPVMAPASTTAPYAEPRRRMLAESGMKLASQQAQAQGEARGELFEYAINGATTLSKGQAAMVPIVSADIGGEPVTVVESGLEKGDITSSNGFYLRNTSGLHLQGGPITVFADGVYGGDALVNNLSPNDSRLITYAVDLELPVLQAEPKTVESVVKVSFVDGVLEINNNQEMTRTWIFKNKSAAAKNVLLQVPEEDGWKLADPKQLESKALGVQRFRVAAKPGETRFSVKWVQTSEETLEILDDSADDIEYYTNEKATSPAVKAKLAQFIAIKYKGTILERQRKAQEQVLKDINADQARIRANMVPLNKNGKLFKSYEDKLGAQENKIENVRAEIERLRTAQLAARNSLRRALEGLNLK